MEISNNVNIVKYNDNLIPIFKVKSNGEVYKLADKDGPQIIPIPKPKDEVDIWV